MRGGTLVKDGERYRRTTGGAMVESPSNNTSRRHERSGEPAHVVLDDRFSWSGRATALVSALLAGGVATIAAERVLGTPISADAASDIGSMVDAMALGIAVLTFTALSARNRAAPDRLNVVTACILAVLSGLILPLDLVPQVVGATSTVALAVAARVVLVSLPFMVNVAPVQGLRVRLPQLMSMVLVATVAISVPLDLYLRFGTVDRADVLTTGLGMSAGIAVVGALRLGVWSLHHREPRGYVLALTLVAIGVADGHASLVEPGSLSSTAGKVMRLIVISAILVYTVIELRDLALRSRERALLALGESERAADRLVAEMSFQERFVHDTRNALLAIQGGLRSLRDVENHAMVDALTTEVERLRGLLEGGSGEPLPTTFDLTHALSPMISCYQAAGRPISLHAAGPMIVRGRPSIAAEVTQNLVENALVHGGPGEITVWLFESGEFIEVRVADRGSGIDIDLRESIFEHGRSGGGGSGVGLHISRRLIEQQGGTLDVTNRDGGGSIFSFTLPRAEMPLCPPAPQGLVSA